MFSLYSVSQYLAAILSTNRDEFDESGRVNEKWRAYLRTSELLSGA